MQKTMTAAELMTAWEADPFAGWQVKFGSQFRPLRMVGTDVNDPEDPVFVDTEDGVRHTKLKGDPVLVEDGT